MILLADHDQLIMPSGRQALYCWEKKQWQYKKVTLWDDLKNIVGITTHRYIKVEVGQSVITPDGHVWYCNGHQSLIEVERYVYSYSCEYKR